ncbi:MAG: glycosyltransferase family 2 protein [Candidatus Omnitrophota bacterium]|nr:MAG: glycosyltransferase family 2 protein [Candidatus Omnitrophota bacterium]RKY37861.1 MAG: glycosyltransferase family 2 protein [Candidatus Omnitrophota bacterium]
MPTVSVVIPTYNRAHLVGRAIESVLNQTFQDFEILVVDDRSVDNTEKVVNDFNDARIRYIKHRINMGGNATRNTGIKNSKGEYIAFLDSDDEWLPEKLKKQIDTFQKMSNKVGLVYSWVEMIDEKGKLFRKLNFVVKGRVLQNILRGNFIPSSTVVVKKECFDEVGLFDESFVSCQDREMWTRIATKYEMEVVPEYLARMYRDKKISISASPKKVVYGYYQYFIKFQKLYLSEGMKEELSQNLSWVAYELIKKGYKEEARECFRLSFKYSKTNWKNYARFLLSLIKR